MMQLNLRTPARRWAAAAALVAVTTGYCGLATCRLLASHLAITADAPLLQRAIQLDPDNAEYRHQAGIHELANQSPRTSIAWLQSAVRLNPHAAKYWMDLAVAQELMDNSAGERASIESALAVDPHTPEIAWQAANLFLAEGLADKAMPQFRTVLENDPPLTGQAITTAWKIKPDVDALLEKVVPPAADVPFLQFLAAKNETAAAEKVWARIFALQQPVSRTDMLEYERYLLSHQEVSQAALVWRQAAKLSDIEAYQPSPENLIINGDFSLDVLNGGFDWVHAPSRGVTVALDPSETHSSSRSLRITLDGSEISDAGISQVVMVEPNARYDFAAFYKAKAMEGAGAMHFAIQDAYRATPLFLSDDLTNADFWKNAGGSFVTSPETRLVSVHILREPPGRPIRGKLWIDGLRLVQGGTEPR
jgi:tetratricopeptide (TPR) repeat protein